MTTTETNETTQAAHTPGPWLMNLAPSQTNTVEPFSFDINCEAGHSLAYVHQNMSPFDGNPIDSDTAQANARLIAAAPDLLAFARECARADSDCGEAIREQARQLIQKAAP